MTTYAQCDKTQAHNTNVAYLTAAKLLGDAAAEYTTLAHTSDNATDQANYAQAALDANAKWGAFNDEYDAFQNSGGDVNPPSGPELVALVDTSSRLAQAIADGKQVSDILALVEKGLLILTSLSPAAATAVAPPPV